MKGGFLSGPPPKKPKKNIKDITHIKAKPDESLKFDEVQNSMKDNIMGSKKEWLNDDLMQKLAKNPKLLKAFGDP
jgi:hypothetical protein